MKVAVREVETEEGMEEAMVAVRAAATEGGW